MRLFVFMFFCILVSSASAANTLVFDMKVLGFSFGKMTVTKQVLADSSELYTLDASGKAKVMWIDFVSHTKQETRFKNGNLLYSVYTEIENGKTKRWNKVVFDGKHYQVDAYNGKRILSDVPNFSIISLYFLNADKIHKIFYEAEANFTSLQKIDNNCLQIKTSDGNRSVYHFLDGKIQSMEFHISIATVYMKLVNSF